MIRNLTDSLNGCKLMQELAADNKELKSWREGYETCLKNLQQGLFEEEPTK